MSPVLLVLLCSLLHAIQSQKNTHVNSAGCKGILYAPPVPATKTRIVTVCIEVIVNDDDPVVAMMADDSIQEGSTAGCRKGELKTFFITLTPCAVVFLAERNPL